jgi:hypothetical protein
VVEERLYYKFKISRSNPGLPDAVYVCVDADPYNFTPSISACNDGKVDDMSEILRRLT